MKNMLDYYHKIHDYREAQLLMAGIRLKVFSHLEVQRSGKEVAKLLGYDCRNLNLFLKSLSAIGLLENQGEVYKNTSSTNALLNEKSSNYIGEGILFREKMMSLENLEERVRYGSIPDLKDGAELYDFYRLAELTRKEMFLGRVQQILKMVDVLFHKDDEFNVLDLGGGSGTLALEIGKAYPNSKIVVFEHSSVAKLPQRLIKEEGLDKRGSVIQGDFNTDDLGKDYDLIIASGVMDFAKSHLDQVTQKIYEGLKMGGHLYVITHGVSEDYLKPKTSIVGWLSGRLDGSNLLTDEKTIIESILNKGFKQEKSEMTDSDALNVYLFKK